MIMILDAAFIALHNFHNHNFSSFCMMQRKVAESIIRIFRKLLQQFYQNV